MAAILIIMLSTVSCMCYVLINKQSIITDGDVFAGTVRIADKKYVYTAFESIGRTKKVAEIDNWEIYEVSEDPNHIFLKMKSFTGEDYIVKEDYKIPTEGKVNCAYADGEKVDDEKILDALTDILSHKYDVGTSYYIIDKKEEKDKWKHVVVGYEDCPVGTDYSIYGIAKVDTKWVVVFRDDISKLEDDKLQVIYHEVDEKYHEVFEHSKIQSDAHYVNHPERVEFEVGTEQVSKVGFSVKGE